MFSLSPAKFFSKFQLTLGDYRSGAECLLPGEWTAGKRGFFARAGDLRRSFSSCTVELYPKGRVKECARINQ
jgi:hypothetical protein